MSGGDPLRGPVQAPVKRLNRVPLLGLLGIGLLVMVAVVSALSAMGSRAPLGGEEAVRAVLPTDRQVDAWLADKPDGLIGTAMAEEAPLPAPAPVAPTPMPMSDPLSIEPAPEAAAPAPSEAEHKHRDAMELAMLNERQRIFEEQMRRRELAIRSVPGVSFKPDDGDTVPSAQGTPQNGSDALVQSLVGLQQQALARAGSGSGGASTLTDLGVPVSDSADGWRHYDHKSDFLRVDSAGELYLGRTREAPFGRTELKAGTVIPATLITGANSDLPGQLLAQVRANVWDSLDGTHVLIPQGARLIGRYDSRVQYAQNRLLVVWSRVIFPDGTSLDLGAMQGHDEAGASGFRDRVNNHYARIFGSAILMSGISAAVAKGTDSGRITSDGDVFESEVAKQLGEVATELLRKNLSIAPTIEIRAGYEFGVMVSKDIILPPYRQTQTAIRRINR